MIRRLCTALLLGLGLWSMPAAGQELLLGEAEIAAVLRHGPWPPPPATDPSNRLSGQPAAIALGRALFFEPRLSPSGRVACARCHQPGRGWADGLARAEGLARLDRNTMTVLDAAGQRWFGWDGRNDSLWAHSIGPLLDAAEMGADAGHLARTIAGDPALATAYRAVFGATPDAAAPEALLVDLGKALAAFQETLVSGPTPFDAFRDALARGDHAAAARLPAAAQRGAALFVGRGRCALCHAGPRFANGEFADAGVPYFIAPGRVDPGRHGGIARLRQSPYTLDGEFNDDPGRAGAWAVRQLAERHDNFGAFKVPGLRNLTRTAPYFHDGSRATLADVVRHYSELDPERLHSDGERILAPLRLTPAESADLVAFLESLSE